MVATGRKQKTVARVMVVMAIIGQLFGLAPAWAHPGHDAAVQHGNHDAPFSDHVHAHDHEDAKQPQQQDHSTQPDSDCCQNGEQCNSCSVGNCSTGSAVTCTPMSFNSPAVPSHTTSLYGVSYQASPISELFRPPIQA